MVNGKRGSMRNLLAVIALPLTLAACGLPPALTIASTVADGFSYVVSGKSVSDHALSMVTTQDCAMLRLFDEREICVDYADDEAVVLMAAASAPAPAVWEPVDAQALVAVAAAPADISGAEAISTASLSAPASKPFAAARFAAAEPRSKPAATVAFAPNVTAGAGDPPQISGVVTVLGSYRQAGIDDAWQIRSDNRLVAAL